MNSKQAAAPELTRKVPNEILGYTYGTPEAADHLSRSRIRSKSVQLQIALWSEPYAGSRLAPNQW
jgi:hypothetical protein